MKEKSFFLVLFLLISAPINKALAVCPVCTVAVGAGLGFSRWLGVDDSVTGVWIGGMLVSTIAWTISWMKTKNITFRGKATIVSLATYALVLFPLYYKGLIGSPFNTFCYVDKLLLGVFVGTVSFLAAIFLNGFLKKRNNNRVYFPFQKVALPVAFLLTASSVLYFLTKCFT